jgi:GPN-loop GTPase
LIDALVLSYPSLYISALLLSLRSMLQLDLPTVNVLTKIDKIADRDPLPFNLDFYTEVHDLNYLLPYLEAEQRGQPLALLRNALTTNATDLERTEIEEETPPSRFDALNKAIISLVNDFSLVAFEPLFVEDKTTMASLLHTIDRASGYAFGAGTMGANETVWSVAVRQGDVGVDIGDVQERWIDRREEMDEEEREKWKQENETGAEDDSQEVNGGEEDKLDDFDMSGVDTSGIKVVRVGNQEKSSNG